MEISLLYIYPETTINGENIKCSSCDITEIRDGTLLPGNVHSPTIVSRRGTGCLPTAVKRKKGEEKNKNTAETQATESSKCDKKMFLDYTERQLDTSSQQ
jgi:hypothetical protein